MSSCLLDLTKEGFIAQLNEQAGTEIDHTQVTLSGVVIDTVPWNSDDDNMTVTIAPSEGSKYTGSKEVTIKSFESGILATMFDQKIPALPTDTSDVILARLDAFYGIRFDKDTPANVTWTDGNKSGQLVIPAHWALMNPLTVNLTPMSPTLVSLMDVTDLGKPQHNMGTTGEELITTDMWARGTYLWSIDFSSVKDVLSKMTAGHVWTAKEMDTVYTAYVALNTGVSSNELIYLTGTMVTATGKVADAPEELKAGLNPNFTNYVITPGTVDRDDKTQKYFIYLHFNE